MPRKPGKYFKDGIDRREVGYYSTPDYLSSYISKTLFSLKPEAKKILDPAVGAGELITNYDKTKYEIDGYDIIHYNGIDNFCQFYHEDFIEKYISGRLLLINRGYDIIVLNPPYNCHEHSFIKNNKLRLKNIFTCGYENLWALFVEAVIEISNDGCLIACILPDSLLYARKYQKLRDMILTRCAIHYIIMCPADLFWNEGANEKTCLLIIQKGKEYQDLIKILNRPPCKHIFQEILYEGNFNKALLNNCLITLTHDQQIFAIGISQEIRTLFLQS